MSLGGAGPARNPDFFREALRVKGTYARLTVRQDCYAASTCSSPTNGDSSCSSNGTNDRDLKDWDERFAERLSTVTAAVMTEALVQSNDRLARTALAKGAAATTFFCECGDCLAAEVRLSLDEHEEIRVREDLIFAPGHDAQRENRSAGGGAARDMLSRSIVRFAEGQN